MIKIFATSMTGHFGRYSHGGELHNSINSLGARVSNRTLPVFYKPVLLLLAKLLSVFKIEL